MFGKCMSISDELMVQYYNLLTATRGADIQKRVQSGELHPKIAKEELAEQLTARFCGAASAAAARSEFNQVFSNRQNPTDMPHTELPAGRHPIVKVVTAAGLAASGGAAPRPGGQGAGGGAGPAVLKVGKKGFASVSSGASAKP